MSISSGSFSERKKSGPAWQRNLQYIREVGPDMGRFNLAVKDVWNHIKRLEAENKNLKERLEKIENWPGYEC
jgi:hypothetical protein